MIEIDGSYLEGGGQILRTALALSMITGKRFLIHDIRKGRRSPGLKPSHLACIDILSSISECTVKGATIGSAELEFTPGKIIKNKIDFDIGTAGSITLVLQSIMPILIHEKKKFKIRLVGGTDVAWSPSWDYFANVIVPQLRRYAEIDAKILKRGYYPKGGGVVEININPIKHHEISLDSPGLLLGIKGVSHAHIDLEGVAERQAMAAKNNLSHLDVPIDIQPMYSRPSSIGSVITLWALIGRGEVNILNPLIVGADALGKKGVKAEVIGEKAAKTLERFIKMPIDPYLTDHMIPYLGLYGGKMKVHSISEHTKTNIYTVERFLGKTFIIEDNLIRAEARLT